MLTSAQNYATWCAVCQGTVCSMMQFSVICVVCIFVDSWIQIQEFLFLPFTRNFTLKQTLNYCVHSCLADDKSRFLTVNQHKQTQSTKHPFLSPGCNIPFHHWRAVGVCSRHIVDKVQQKPSWEQRISWWSSTIKRLLYVNRVNPLWEWRVLPGWFHARSTHWKRTSGQQSRIVMRKKRGIVKSQPLTRNHFTL